MQVINCPVCNSSSNLIFLKRNSVPVHQNLLFKNKEDALDATRGDLNLALCKQCGFVFNKTFNLELLSYGQNYDNTQTHSSYFEKYIDEIVLYLIEKKGVRNCSIVEVGCGKGTFLKKLVSHISSNNIGIGFDPSYIGDSSLMEGRLTFQKTYYDEQCANVHADVVICRHVIEHVPYPLELLRSIRAALRNSPKARVFVETPCINWILSNRVIWDFFYEHCSLFSKNSLEFALRKSGFVVDSAEQIFGGQYLWLEAHVSEENNTLPPLAGIENLIYSYTNEESLKIQRWSNFLERETSSKNIAIWGAGAKGATFLNLIDPQARLIDSVIDLNPNKQGRYIPGTGHQIIGPKEIISRNIKEIINMNPNYFQENMNILKTAGMNINLINWDK